MWSRNYVFPRKRAVLTYYLSTDFEGGEKPKRNNWKSKIFCWGLAKGVGGGHEPFKTLLYLFNKAKK